MTVRLFLADKFLPNYVEAVFASRRLPPKAAVSAYRRHSFVEGIRNGGLDFVKAAVSVFRAWRLPAERRLFFFCRRPADVDKKFSKVDCNYNSLIVSVIAKLRMRFAGA